MALNTKLSPEPDWFILTEQCNGLLTDIVAHFTETYRTTQKEDALSEAKKFAMMQRDSSIFASKQKMIEIIGRYRSLV